MDPIWRHTNGAKYKVLLFAVEEATLIPIVIYRAFPDGPVWSRPCSEFFDGRFSLVEAGGSQDKNRTVKPEENTERLVHYDERGNVEFVTPAPNTSGS